METKAGRPRLRKRKLAAVDALAVAEPPNPRAERGDGVPKAGRGSSRKRKLAALDAAEAPNTQASPGDGIKHPPLVFARTTQGPPLPGADRGAGDRISHRSRLGPGDGIKRPLLVFTRRKQGPPPAMETKTGSPRSRKLAAVDAPAVAEPPNTRAEMKDQKLTLPREGGGEGGDGNRISHLPDGVVETGCDSSRKRKLVALDAAEPPNTEAGIVCQEPQLPGTDRDADDRISNLPDGVLGDIISLLPTKEGARTQVLASRWRHVWRAAPLNLDHRWLGHQDYALDSLVSRILAAHPGPGRRFCLPVYHLHADQADAWLRSPALDNLQELDMCSFGPRLPYPRQPLPAAVFRFSETLRVATIGDSDLSGNTTQVFHFPKLKQLTLKRVGISECSLHNMIAGCPALECLLIRCSFGFRCVRINSSSLTSIGVGVEAVGYDGGLPFKELIIENAPCLERLLQLSSSGGMRVSVISAPKLETLGCLYSTCSSATLTFDSTVIQGLRVHSHTTVVHTVKILSINMQVLSLDAVIDLLRCFPCLEKLYVEWARETQLVAS